MNKDEMIKEMQKDLVMAEQDCVWLYEKEGYRKVADDEIVIKKQQYEQLKKYNRDRKRLRLRWQQAKQETAREILQEFLKEFVVYACVGDYYTATEIYNKIQEIAKEKGIELE